MKFAEEFVMYTEKHVLVKEMLTNRLSMGLSLWTWDEKTVDGVEIYQFFGKEITLGTAVCKEGHADSFLWYE